ncbi:hypothetical protein LOZ10_001779 [Ophidiomyces ophidiicola]|nr:hypothetical protein LOZ10_001779 [Ophidiomyces ophidiicola]
MTASLAPRCYAASSYQFRIRTLAIAREFSSTCGRWDDSTRDPPKRPSNAHFDRPFRRQQQANSPSRPSSSPHSKDFTFRSFKPGSSPGIDARSLGANPGSSDNNGNPRMSLSIRRVPHGGGPNSSLRSGNQKILSAANSSLRLRRNPAGSKRRSPQAKLRRPIKKATVFEQDSFEDDDRLPEGDIIGYENELLQKKYKKPEQYTPTVYTVEKLKDTWPALPIGQGDNLVANSVNVMDRLNWLGARYLGSYETPQELAKRMMDGKRVYFKSDDEKAEVLDIVKEMATKRTEEMTERKGTIVPPQEAGFEAVTDKETESLVTTLVKGRYDRPLVDKQKAGPSPLVADVLRQLTNNGTYQNVHAEKFLTKFLDHLPANLKNKTQKAI